MRIESQKLENATLSADEVVDMLIRRLLTMDPSLSYTQFLDLKDFYKTIFMHCKTAYFNKSEAVFQPARSGSSKTAEVIAPTSVGKPAIQNVMESRIAHSNVSYPNILVEGISNLVTLASPDVSDHPALNSESNSELPVVDDVFSVKKLEQEQDVIASTLLDQKNFDNQREGDPSDNNQNVIVVQPIGVCDEKSLCETDLVQS